MSVSFDRPAFEAQVLSRSPLRPEQFDTMLGGMDGTKKRLAWQLLNMSSRDQFAVWWAVSKVQKAFPAAVLTRV